MDNFNNVLMTSLGLEGLEGGSSLAVYGGSESSFIKNILICVPKMNEGITGSERHEGM